MAQPHGSPGHRLSLWPHAVHLDQQRRAMSLSAALERIADLRDSMIAELDQIDGDADLEDSDEDIGCEDEGIDDCREPEGSDFCVRYASEHDQTKVVDERAPPYLGVVLIDTAIGAS